MAPCSIKGCGNRGEKQTKKNGITYHLYPRDMIKRRKWTDIIDRPNWKPSNSSVICSVHFEDKFFYTTQSGLKKLVDGAFPSIDIHIKKNLTTNTQDRKSSILPKFPEISQDDSQKTKELAAQLHKLCNIYEEQKKRIRFLRQKYKRQEIKLENLKKLQHPFKECVKNKNEKKRKKKLKILKVDVETLNTIESIEININNKLTDPLS